MMRMSTMPVSIRPTEASSLFGQTKTTISRDLDATPHILASVEDNAVTWWSRSAKLEEELPVTMCGKSINPPQLQISSQLQRFPWARPGPFVLCFELKGKGSPTLLRLSRALSLLSAVPATARVLSHWCFIFAFQGVESVCCP